MDTLVEQLHDAASFGRLSDVKRLVASGVDVDAVNEYGDTALHVAAVSGALAVVRYLVASGAAVNARDVEGGTGVTRCGVFVVI